MLTREVVKDNVILRISSVEQNEWISQMFCERYKYPRAELYIFSELHKNPPFIENE